MNKYLHVVRVLSMGELSFRIIGMVMENTMEAAREKFKDSKKWKQGQSAVVLADDYIEAIDYAWRLFKQ